MRTLSLFKGIVVIGHVNLQGIYARKTYTHDIQNDSLPLLLMSGESVCSKGDIRNTASQIMSRYRGIEAETQKR